MDTSLPAPSGRDSTSLVHTSGACLSGLPPEGQAPQLPGLLLTGLVLPSPTGLYVANKFAPGSGDSIWDPVLGPTARFSLDEPNCVLSQLGPEVRLPTCLHVAGDGDPPLWDIDTPSTTGSH